MKILVDEMPAFLDDSPFFDYNNCKLSLGNNCPRADMDMEERDNDSCEYLITIDAYMKGEK